MKEKKKKCREKEGGGRGGGVRGQGWGLEAEQEDVKDSRVPFVALPPDCCLVFSEGFGTPWE